MDLECVTVDKKEGVAVIRLHRPKVLNAVESYPQIQEMELNPVIVHHKGLSIVDARIFLKPAMENEKIG